MNVNNVNCALEQQFKLNAFYSLRHTYSALNFLGFIKGRLMFNIRCGGWTTLLSKGELHVAQSAEGRKKGMETKKSKQSFKKNKPTKFDVKIEIEFKSN